MLKDIDIRNAEIKEKDYKIYDKNGLYLRISSKGGKYWHFKYKIGGKEKLESFGQYPMVSVSMARKKRDELRVSIAKGNDPSEVRALKKSNKEKYQLERVAREWALKKSSMWSEDYYRGVIRRLENDIFPWLGSRDLREITPQEILKHLERTQKRGAMELAHRLKQTLSQVYQYAMIARDGVTHDPAYSLSKALIHTKTIHQAAILDPQEFGMFLRKLEGMKGSLQVTSALKILPYLFTRPGELRHMEWSEIDFDNAIWSIPPEKMKMRQAHIVPLATQVITVLKDIQPLTGSRQYVFHTPRDPNRPLSENAFIAAFRGLGFGPGEITAHGFRATARTLLDEQLDFRPEIIEHQLAHAVRDANGRAYNRTQHLVKRKEMMQAWADYLDQLKSL